MNRKSWRDAFFLVLIVVGGLLARSFCRPTVEDVQGAKHVQTRRIFIDTLGDAKHLALAEITLESSSRIVWNKNPACHTAVYVAEGALALDPNRSGEATRVYERGSAFSEPQRLASIVYRNASAPERARVLLISICTETP